MKKIGCSWSDGKDSCYALMQVAGNDTELQVLVNMINEHGLISRSHGLPLAILQEQADAMNAPLIARPTSWTDYERIFVGVLEEIRDDYAVERMIFGDIDLQAHRDWEETVCSKAGLEASLPLWKKDTKKLVCEMLGAGVETMIVSCNAHLGEEFLGQVLTFDLISKLEAKGVDVCGENGEYHTLVINCPLFKKKIDIPAYTKVRHEEYWFLKWEL